MLMTKKSFAIIFDSVCEISYTATLSSTHLESVGFEMIENNLLSTSGAGEIPLFCTVSLVIASNIAALVGAYTAIKNENISCDMICSWIFPMLRTWVMSIVSSSADPMAAESEIRLLLLNVFQVARLSILSSIDSLSTLQSFLSAILSRGRSKVLSIFKLISDIGIHDFSVNSCLNEFLNVLSSVVSAINFCVVNIPLLASRSNANEYRCSSVVHFICKLLIKCCHSLSPDVCGSVSPKPPSTSVPVSESFCNCCFNFSSFGIKLEFLNSIIEETIQIINMIFSKFTSLKFEIHETSLVLFSIASVVNVLNVGVARLLSQWSHLSEVSALLNKVISTLLLFDMWITSVLPDIWKQSRCFIPLQL